MDEAEYGRRLGAAMRARKLGREAVGDYAGVKPRTVTNWTNGSTTPGTKEKALLRELLGPFDTGDDVEVALRSSTLSEWRQDAVLSTYKRHLHEQRAEESA